MFEAFDIIEKEIETDEKLEGAIETCDALTMKSYRALLDFMKTDDFKLLTRIRENISFHYGAKVVTNSLKRILDRQTKRTEKRWVNKQLSLTLGEDALDWSFDGWIENDIVVYGIFKLPDDDDPTEVQAKTDEIIVCTTWYGCSRISRAWV